MRRKRTIVSLLIAGVLVLVASFVAGGGIDDIDSPNWSGNFLVDRTGTHRGAIYSDGTLAVRAHTTGDQADHHTDRDCCGRTQAKRHTR